jgi:hypothetical protein
MKKILTPANFPRITAFIVGMGRRLDNHPITKQFIYEMSVPGVLGMIWTVVDFQSTGSWTKTIANCIASFGKAFFLTSWLLSQILRIAKQKNTESSFSDLKVRANTMLDNLNETATELMNQMTGGDSYPRFLLSASRDGSAIDVTMDHRGRYPLIDLNIEIFSIDSFEYDDSTKARMLGTGPRILERSFLAVQPGAPTRVATLSWPAADAANKLFLIRSRARNGVTEQVVAMKLFPNWPSAWAELVWIFTSQKEVKREKRLPAGEPEWPTNGASRISVSISMAPPVGLGRA